MTESYPIRSIAAEEFAALAEVPGEAFLDASRPEGVEHERQVAEIDRTIAAFDGDEMVGSASAYSFTLTVPGASAAAAGITMVGVVPAYRRRGILSSMMNYLLTDAAGRGEPLAILFASESGIYSRFGFGLASSHLRLQIGRGEGTIAIGEMAPGPGKPRLRPALPVKAQSELAAVYDKVLSARPGMVARDGRWWGYRLCDPEFHRDGMSPLRCLLAEDDSGPRGYALYRTKRSWGADGLPAGMLRVQELMSTDAQATASLWTNLLNRDLVAEIIAPLRPVDDPLLAMLADPRRARPALSDGLWVRLIDLPAALCGRQYAADIDIVLEVVDSHFIANHGRWRLTAGGLEPGGSAAVASCERVTDAADIRLPATALGAAYLGGGKLGQLAAAGHVLELTPGSVARLSAAMSWDPAPWNCMIF
ncbi:MAG: GNAT family N-acetyltransferase [Streptosporangiaceae bacterium]